MTIFQDKLLRRAYCDQVGDYAAHIDLSPRDLNYQTIIRSAALERKLISALIFAGFIE